MKMASRSIHVISKKTNLQVQLTFFSSNYSKKTISKKAKLHVLHAFSLLLFCTTRLQCRFVRLKRQISLLIKHYFYGEIVYVLTSNFVSCVHVMFSLLSFSPCWPPAFLLFYTASMKFLCFFFQRNSSPWCSFTRSSSFSVIHMSVHIKNKVEKNTTFFFSKSPGHSKLNLELHLGYHTC